MSQRSLHGLQVLTGCRPLSENCGLCLETSPKLLPCSHSFCLPCLTQILHDNQHPPSSSPSPSSSTSSTPSPTSFPCPTCRSPTDIPPGGVEDLHNGFNWKQLPCQQNPIVLTRFSWSRNSGKKNSHNHHNHHHSSRSEKKKKRKGTMSPERPCPLHPEEQLRFYCTRCCTPICRDCKIACHETHPATDLSQKGQEARTMATLVMEMSRGTLEPKLRKSLQEAKTQREKLGESKGKLLETLQRRSERLKEVIDQALTIAAEDLDKETDNVDGVLASFVDRMSQGLGSLLSFTEHAQNVTEKGHDVDVVELLPQLKKLFSDPEQQRGRGGEGGGRGGGGEEFELLEKDSSGQTRSSGSEGIFGCFLRDDWKLGLKLSQSTGTQQCPFCSFNYSQTAFTCPRCCDKKPAPKKNLFSGFKVRLCAANDHGGPQLKCQTCCQNYDTAFDFCPSCGMPASQDSLATFKTLVPRYLGYVVQKHQSAGEGAGGAHGERSSCPSGKERERGQRGGGSPGRGSSSPPSSLPPSTPEDPKALEIYNTIATISALLQEWK